MWKLIVATFIICSQHHVSGQCLRSLSNVFTAENNVKDIKVQRNYVLCANTRFEPGVLNEKTGEIEGGEFPVAMRPNSLLKCGSSGSSSNNCVIDGTGTYAMFLTPTTLFNDPNSKNIVVQGITVDFWVRQGQLPIIVAGISGDVTFTDCIFSNNLADPLFTIDEIVLGNSARSAALPSGGELDQKPGFKPNFSYYVGGNATNRRLLSRDDLFNDDGDPEIVPEHPVFFEADNVTVGSERRKLQLAAFRVVFQKCLFDFNSPVRNAITQAGLSVVRIRGRSDPTNPNPGAFKEYVGKMDTRFIQNTFRENIFSFTGDRAVYRSIIDHYSSGRLILRQNCFEDSPAKAFGVVTVNVGATIVNDANFIDKIQTNLRCPFIAVLNNVYVVQRCGGAAQASSCRANPSSGFGGICFPGNALCEVEERGPVMMQDLKLGDKVLVEGGKYESVYSFGHYDNKSETEYLRIVTTGTPLPLEISKQHLVFVDGYRSVPALAVKIGDKLELGDGKLVTVKSIKSVRKRGAFAPFTQSGTIVVNNVKTSTFVGFQDTGNLVIAGVDTGLSYHFCALAFELPHRVWCKYFSSCTSEEYTEEGISTWVAASYQLLLWFFEHQPIVMFLLVLPMVAFFTVLMYPLASLLTMAALWMVSGGYRRLLCGKAA